MSDSNVLVLVDDDGEEYEVDASDCEEDESGEGVWCCFSEDGEEHYFEYEDEEDDSEEE